MRAAVELDAICNGLKMLANKINMPPVDIILPRLKHMPRLPDELGEAIFGVGAIKFELLPGEINVRDIKHRA